MSLKRRTPPGVRGLKQNQAAQVRQDLNGRTPPGVRGLKHYRVNHSACV